MILGIEYSHRSIKSAIMVGFYKYSCNASLYYFLTKLDDFGLQLLTPPYQNDQNLETVLGSQIHFQNVLLTYRLSTPKIIEEIITIKFCLIPTSVILCICSGPDSRRIPEI